MNGQPVNSYLICTTPRSGSTLLCELLTGTGVAGRPDEYFQQLRSTRLPMTPRDYLEGVAADIVPLEDHEGKLEQHELFDPRRFAGFEEYVDWVTDRATTPNGVFGAKIMWPYVAGLVDGLADIPRHRDVVAPNDLLSHAFPNLRFVWLRRRDQVRQAVSLWRAVQTWHWRKDVAPAEDRSDQPAPHSRLRYSFEAIDHLRRRIAASDRSWATYFEATDADPMTVIYEDFVQEMQATLTTILRHVGADPGAQQPCRPRTARQSDDLTEHWVSRYGAEALALR